jgi:hypothetical protein
MNNMNRLQVAESAFRHIIDRLEGDEMRGDLVSILAMATSPGYPTIAGFFTVSRWMPPGRASSAIGRKFLGP